MPPVQYYYMGRDNASSLCVDFCYSVDKSILHDPFPLWLISVLIIGLLGNIVNITVFRHASVKSVQTVQSSLFYYTSICNLLKLVGIVVFTFLNHTPSIVITLFLPRFEGVQNYDDKLNFDLFFIAGFLLMSLHTVTTILTVKLTFMRHSQFVNPAEYVRLIMITVVPIGFIMSAPLLFVAPEVTNSNGYNYRVHLRSPASYEGMTAVYATLHAELFVVLSASAVTLIFGILRIRCRRQCSSPAIPYEKIGKGKEPPVGQITKLFTDTTLLIHVLIFLILEIPILVASVLPAILRPDDTDKEGCPYMITFIMNVFILPAMLLSSSYTMICFLLTSVQYRKTLSVVKSELGSTISTGRKRAQQVYTKIFY